MSFFNENVSLAYFAILGELLSGLSFTVGFFKTLSFLSSLVGFIVGFLHSTLKDIPYNGDFRETLDE